MQTKFATKDDVSQIVSLLKLSLGESLMPKSIDYWGWKHINNPFGESPVLLAIENEKIIGVRAFMTWRWRRGAEVYKAIRAVDTATHPEHQGRGIFKTLTLNLLDECEKTGVDMVYNTPNDKSKPGYIKMGWESAGKLPVKVGLKRPFSILFNKIRNRSETEFISITDSDFQVGNAIERFSGELNEQQQWQTDSSKEYLQWRYLNIPIIEYGGASSGQALVIFRLKNAGLGVELRICDTFGDKKDINTLIGNVYERFNFDFISLGGFNTSTLPSWLQKTRSGPDVTIKPINKDIKEFRNFEDWAPSLGDLEVF